MPYGSRRDAPNSHMSVFTNVVLKTSVGDKGRIAELNKAFRSGKGFVSCDDASLPRGRYACEKFLECNIYPGPFNYLALEARRTDRSNSELRLGRPEWRSTIHSSAGRGPPEEGQSRAVTREAPKRRADATSRHVAGTRALPSDSSTAPALRPNGRTTHCLPKSRTSVCRQYRGTEPARELRLLSSPGCHFFSRSRFNSSTIFCRTASRRAETCCMFQPSTETASSI
jgi:hypothetical protein